jgi:hypothetical protein
VTRHNASTVHVYYVTYSHPHGLGALSVTMTLPIDSWQTVEAVRDYTAQVANLPAEGVVVLSWQLLRTEPAIPAAPAAN